jgi:hypothetical protein
MISPLAIQQPRRTDRITRRTPFGFLLHTTGGSITAKAAKTGRSPIDVALDVYRRMQGATGGQGSEGYPWGGPAYLIGHHGEIHQIADDDVETFHAGGPDRAAYLSGAWRARVSAETSKRWQAAWPGVASPQHLYPSASANADYVGAEMVPVAVGMGTPMAPGLRFTLAQHDAAILLGRDLAVRHGWPAGWARTPRLLGHEDVQPIQRSDVGGGWDPGALRARPYLDFEYIRFALSR